MEQFKIFNLEKSEIVSRLTNLKNIVVKLEDVGVEVSS